MVRKSLVLLCLGLILFGFSFGLFFSPSPARAFDWRGQAQAAIRQMTGLLEQAKSYNLVQVDDYWSQLRPSISGAVPWIDSFLSDDRSDIASYQAKLETAQQLYDRGEYVAIFKVLRLNILNDQLQQALVQRRAAVDKIKAAISSSLVPPEKLAGRLAALQKKYWDRLGAIINPIYLPELTPSRITFLEHNGYAFIYVALTENVTFSAAGANQNTRIAGNFNVVVTDLLMGDIPLANDFYGYVFDTTYYKTSPKVRSGGSLIETIDYVLANKDIRDWRALKITSQELIDRSIVMISGKRVKVVLSEGDE